MWNTLARHELSAFDTILWNIFPFHPHKKDDLLTNRTPTNEELDAGIEYAKMLLALVPTLKIVAIGQKSAGTLQRYGVECVACVLHPWEAPIVLRLQLHSCLLTGNDYGTSA